MTAPTPENLRVRANALEGVDLALPTKTSIHVIGAREALRAAADQLEAVQTEHYSVADRASIADQSWIVDGDRVTYGEVSSTGELVIVMIERRVDLIEDEVNDD